MVSQCEVPRAHNIQTHQNIVVPSGEELRVVAMSDKLASPFSFLYNSKKVMVTSMVLVILFLFYRIFSSDPQQIQSPEFQRSYGEQQRMIGS